MNTRLSSFSVRGTQNDFSCGGETWRTRERGMDKQNSGYESTLFFLFFVHHVLHEIWPFRSFLFLQQNNRKKIKGVLFSPKVCRLRCPLSVCLFCSLLTDELMVIKRTRACFLLILYCLVFLTWTLVSFSGEEDVFYALLCVLLLLVNIFLPEEKQENSWFFWEVSWPLFSMLPEKICKAFDERERRTSCFSSDVCVICNE